MGHGIMSQFEYKSKCYKTVNLIDSGLNVNLYRITNKLNSIDERTYQITGFH